MSFRQQDTSVYTEKWQERLEQSRREIRIDWMDRNREILRSDDGQDTVFIEDKVKEIFSNEEARLVMQMFMKFNLNENQYNYYNTNEHVGEFAQYFVKTHFCRQLKNNLFRKK